MDKSTIETYRTIRKMMIDSKPKPESKIKTILTNILLIILFIIILPFLYVFAHWIAYMLEQQF